MNYWTKIAFIVFALGISIITWVQFNNLTRPSSAPVPVVQKLYFEGTIGGKHSMSLSINQVGKNITGTIVNTHREIRKLKGTRFGGARLLIGIINKLDLAASKTFNFIVFIPKARKGI